MPGLYGQEGFGLAFKGCIGGVNKVYSGFRGSIRRLHRGYRQVIFRVRRTRVMMKRCIRVMSKGYLG